MYVDWSSYIACVVLSQVLEIAAIQKHSERVTVRDAFQTGNKKRYGCCHSLHCLLHCSYSSPRFRVMPYHLFILSYAS